MHQLSKILKFQMQQYRTTRAKWPNFWATILMKPPSQVNYRLDKFVIILKVFTLKQYM